MSVRSRFAIRASNTAVTVNTNAKNIHVFQLTFHFVRDRMLHPNVINGIPSNKKLFVTRALLHPYSGINEIE